MAFKPGHKLSHGRPRGSINRRTQEFQAYLEEKNFNIAEAMLDIRDEAAKQYKKCDEYDPLAAIAALKLLRDVTSDIASYALPKIKSVDSVQENPLDQMTAQDKLEVMREAVKLLEHETKEVPSDPLEDDQS